jgi:membrane-bound hydrogenase subunit beta
MSKEEKIISELTHKFPFLSEKCVIIRPRRITIEVDRDKVIEVFKYLYSEQKFDFISTITGLDSGENLEFIYHLNNIEGVLINAKVFAPKTDPVIKSVLEVYAGATYYEKELVGMLGAIVEGLPEGRHYPLPENWPQDEHPLRKDWKPKNIEGQSVEPNKVEE